MVARPPELRRKLECFGSGRLLVFRLPGRFGGRAGVARCLPSTLGMLASAPGYFRGHGLAHALLSGLESPGVSLERVLVGSETFSFHVGGSFPSFGGGGVGRHAVLVEIHDPMGIRLRAVDEIIVVFENKISNRFGLTFL